LATLASPGVSATARSRTDVTDHDLVEAVRAGDDHAFERLYQRYHRRISAYIFGMVHDHGRAEDVTQEVFVSALRRMRQTDRPIVFKPWIYEIAKNACIDQFRRTSRTEEVSIDAHDGSGLSGADHGKLHARGQTPDAAIESKQQLADLQGAFGELSDAHHQILVMRELEGLSYREIGERLGMSRPAVESTLFRARRRLTEEYEELRTGERCVRIQAIIETATGGRLGVRDQRRVSSHITHCQPCRKQAVMAGLDAGVLARRPVRAKIAAFLPLPAFLKRWIDPAAGGGADAASGHVALAQATTTVAQHGDAMAGWMKAGAVAAAVALAGVGTGAVEHVAGSGGAKRPGDVAAAQAAPAAKVKASGDPAGGGAAAGGAAGSGGSGGGATRHGAGGSGGPRGTHASKAHGSTSHSSSAGLGETSGPAGAADGSGHSGAKGFSGGGSSSGDAGSSGGRSGGADADAHETSASGSKGTSSTKPSGSSSTTTTTTSVTQPVQSATTTATAPATGSSQPLVDPNLGALTGGGGGTTTSQQPPASLGGAVSGATDAVGDTVGGQVGETVKGTGQAVGNTVDGVLGAVGSLLGGKKTQ
jgi:RNA polymerase sigma factor (sigma-70 family)